MTQEELYQRIDTALRFLRDAGLKWGRIVIEIERGEPRHVNVEMEIKTDGNKPEQNTF